MMICERCDRPVGETLDVVCRNGVHKWCYRCVDDGAFICRECGTLYNYGAARVYFMHADDIVGSSDDSGAICQSCYEEYYFHCWLCQRLHHVDNLAFDIFDRRRVRVYHFCSECGGSISPESAREMLGIHAQE